jgi:Domain of unknown function (DUF4268)
MKRQLGKLESIPLREAWEHEASQFTPWLAQPENIELLSEALGIELEITAREQSVGSFSADILCKDAATGQTVLIENQLERTDHTHLGQIITYAAGLNANTVVWISASLREEHRAAIDWLNENTIETLQFFGVEVELWRIGDSPYAPKFNMVSKPNDWSKTVYTAAHNLAVAPLSETKLQQQRYWAALGEFIERNDYGIRPQKPLPQHWTNFSIGRSGMHLAATVNSVEERIGVELYLSSGQAKEQFKQLEQNKPQVEAAIGEKLEWQELPGRKAARIALYKQNVDPGNEGDWANQHEWLASKIGKFNEVFRPLVKSIL